MFFFKVVVIFATFFVSSICNASMHEKERYVNKSVHINLEDIMFTKEGMFLIQNNSQAIRVYKLANENNDYIAFYRIDYVCGECHSTYNENPGTCEVCGSTDIREREMDLFPIG